MMQPDNDKRFADKFRKDAFTAEGGALAAERLSSLRANLATMMDAPVADVRSATMSASKGYPWDKRVNTLMGTSGAPNVAILDGMLDRGITTT